MKAVKNIAGVNLDVDFNGETYHFSKTPVSISEELFKHLQERYPLAFDFEFKGKQVVKVKSTKTPVRIAYPVTSDGVDMRAGLKSSPKMMFNEVDGLPGNGNTDSDNVEWTEEIEMTGGK